MIIYTYQADLWCGSCGEKIAVDLTAEGLAPDDPEDLYSFDSDDFPKPATEDESDSPNHCASGGECLEAIDLAGYGLADGRAAVRSGDAGGWRDRMRLTDK